MLIVGLILLVIAFHLGLIILTAPLGLLALACWIPLCFISGYRKARWTPHG
jgi:hypothetical protein